MIFILNGASFASTIGTIPDISKYIGSVGTGGTGGTTEPIDVELTFNYSPVSATLTLTYNDGTSDQTKIDTGDGIYKLTIKSGTSISWTLEADGYNDKSGTIIMPAWNKSETHSLVSIGGGGSEGDEPETPVNPPSGNSWFEADATAIDLTSTAATSEGIITGNGSAGASSYFETKTIDVSAYTGKMVDFTFVKYTSGAGAAPGYACGFINAQNQFTLLEAVPTSKLGNTKGEIYLITNILIPHDAVSFKTVWFNDNAVSKGVYSGEVSDFEIRVKDVIEMIETDITSSFTWTEGKAIETSTGNEKSSGIFKSSNYVDISDADMLSLSFMQWASSSNTSSGYGLVFYDSNKERIQGIVFPTAATGASSGASYTLNTTIPADAVYIRTTYHKDTASYGEFTAIKKAYK